MPMQNEHVTIHTRPDSKLLEVRLTGKLETADYEIFVPEFEQLAAVHDKLRLLVILEPEFAGWDAAALWEDAKLDARHFNDIEKVAIVGDKTWEKGMAIFCKPFTLAEVRFFDRDDLQSARDWLAE